MVMFAGSNPPPRAVVLTYTKSGAVILTYLSKIPVKLTPTLNPTLVPVADETRKVTPDIFAFSICVQLNVLNVAWSAIILNTLVLELVTVQ